MEQRRQQEKANNAEKNAKLYQQQTEALQKNKDEYQDAKPISEYMALKRELDERKDAQLKMKMRTWTVKCQQGLALQ